MKKQIAMIAMMASLVTTTAFAEGVKIDGSIKSAETKTILAPYSGVVDNYAVTAGDAVSMGDALFALRTEQIYADFDGTVTAVLNIYQKDINKELVLHRLLLVFLKLSY